MIESATCSVSEIQKSAEKYFSTTDKGKGTGYKQYKRKEYNAQRLADENGYLKSDNHYLKEWEKLNASINKSGHTFNYFIKLNHSKGVNTAKFVKL